MSELVLSLFPGIDLFGMAFEELGFIVVRGPDPIFGGRIEDFTPPAGIFDGIIAGPPCQDFSRARRCPPSGAGQRLLREFVRCVEAGRPEWFAMENVIGVPEVQPRGYHVQRLNLNAKECGSLQNRPRRFQLGFLSRVSVFLDLKDPAGGDLRRACLASEGNRVGRRSWEEFCELQGLNREFSLPGWTRSARYRAVGNGVPLPMGRVIAAAIRDRNDTSGRKPCVCDCGRPVPGKGNYASAACRKRMERRRRVNAGVSGPGFVTLDATQ